MDKIALQQGLKRVMYAIVLAFIGPFVIMQAFKNEGHPWYWPVLIIGLVLSAGSIGLGFLGIGKLTSAFLGKKEKDKWRPLLAALLIPIIFAHY